jgi:uncharacterized protein YjbJ (UPF0337 family)
MLADDIRRMTTTYTPVRYASRSARMNSKGSVSEGLGGSHMNKDVYEGKLKEMHSQIKEWWGKLTDDELEQAGGNTEQIVGLLQQKYGYTRERAKEEFNRRIKDVKEAVKKSEAPRTTHGKSQKGIRR